MDDEIMIMMKLYLCDIAKINYFYEIYFNITFNIVREQYL